MRDAFLKTSFSTLNCDLQLKSNVLDAKTYFQDVMLLQRASEIEHILEQLGEEASSYDLGIRSAVHKKVLELRVSDVSPSKISRCK